MAAGNSALVLMALIISGYLFNQIFYPLRYFSSRAEGQKLFFMAAGAGLILGGVVFGITGAIKALDAFSSSPLAKIAAAIDHAIPVPYACRLILTVVTAIVGAFVMNGALRLRYWREWQSPIAKLVYNKLTDEYGNAMSQLLRQAAVTQKLVMLTLKSRKIYCGRILEVPPTIEREDACIELLPLFSGYRDKDSLRMGKERTEYPVISLWEARQYLFSRQQILAMFDYEIADFGDIGSIDAVRDERNRLIADVSDATAVLDRFGDVQKLDIVDWNKVIPIKEIESASFYDQDAYKTWFMPPASERAADTTSVD